MAKFETLEIQMKVIANKNLMACVKIIRPYVEIPITELLEALKKQTPVLTVVLENTKFYEGWQKVDKLMAELKKQECTVQLFVNGELAEECFMNDLKLRLNNIRRSDIS